MIRDAAFSHLKHFDVCGNVTAANVNIYAEKLNCSYELDRGNSR